MVHNCERSCWRIGELVTLKAGLDAVFRERKTLREAPERSIVTVVALERYFRGQWRSIDPIRAELEGRVESILGKGVSCG